MGNSYTSTSPSGFLLLVVLVPLSTGTTTSADYCGSTKVSDPNFPGYVDYVLTEAIQVLVMENDSGVSLRYPPFGGRGASSTSYCWLKDMNECNKCLNMLLPYVFQCSSYDSGSAIYYSQCSLSFKLS